MEQALIKAILLALTWVAGLSWIGSMAFSLLEISGWKTTLLFFVAIISAMVRLVVYCIKSYQDIQHRSREERKHRQDFKDY